MNRTSHRIRPETAKKLVLFKLLEQEMFDCNPIRASNRKADRTIAMFHRLYKSIW